MMHDVRTPYLIWHFSQGAEIKLVMIKGYALALSHYEDPCQYQPRRVKSRSLSIHLDRQHHDECKNSLYFLCPS